MAYDFSSFIAKAEKALAHIRQEVSLLRTGRASAQMLDIVSVEAYGSRMKIQEVANVSVPDPSQMVISPWDKSLISAIEKAISTSGLNLPPVVDGNIIRISVPALTEERRKEMVKLLSQKIETGRVLMRNVRADIKKEVDQLKDDGVSEDQVERDLQELEKKVKEYMEKIEKIAVDKEKELMTV